MSPSEPGGPRASPYRASWPSTTLTPASRAIVSAALAVGPVFIDAGGSRTAVAVDGGFLHVAHEEDVTRVDILAEHALLPEELGQDTAEDRERRAEELRSEDRFDEAREERAKAATRRRVAENG